jgi:Carbohydrate esterase, sialic acid-specific acetylesterase
MRLTSTRPSVRLTLLVAAFLAPACGLSEIPTGVRPGTGGTGGSGETPDPGPGTGSGGSAGTGSGPGGGSGAGGTSGTGGTRDAGAPRADTRDVRPLPGDAAAIDTAPSGDPLGSVVIGGRALPKEKVLVFLHIGHSNMAGRTNTPAEMRPFYFQTDPRLWTFAGATWAPAIEPLSGDFLTRGRAGPGMAILRTAMAMGPSDAVMVSIGKGQDGSRGGACKNYRRGGLLYDYVMGPAKQLKGKVTFAGIFSMLVLMEIYDKPNLPRSHECMEGVARDMREDLEDPNIPFMMSDWEMGATGRFSPTLPDAVTARAQLKLAQQNIARSAIIPCEMLPMSDDHHYDLNGYKLWAERAFALMQMNGWTTWAASAQ